MAGSWSGPQQARRQLLGEPFLVARRSPAPLAHEHATEIVACQRPKDIGCAGTVQLGAKCTGADDVLDDRRLPGATVLRKTELQLVQLGNHCARRPEQAQLHAHGFVDVAGYPSCRPGDGGDPVEKGRRRASATAAGRGLHRSPVFCKHIALHLLGYGCCA